jgi:hypothetical protein
VRSALKLKSRDGSETSDSLFTFTAISGMTVEHGSEHYPAVVCFSIGGELFISFLPACSTEAAADKAMNECVALNTERLKRGETIPFLPAGLANIRNKLRCQLAGKVMDSLIQQSVELPNGMRGIRCASPLSLHDELQRKKRTYHS